jgi:spore maturation protein CgeB
MADGGMVGDAYSLGPRAFEIAACGAFQLCDDTRPELREIFDDTVATYTDGRDLQSTTAYYLAHDAKRQEMAQEARRRVAPCSFLNRAREIVVPELERLI